MDAPQELHMKDILETRVSDAKQLINRNQGITTLEIIKRLSLGDPTKPKAGSYRVSTIKLKLGLWLFVQKAGKLTRWFSREYAIQNNIVPFVDQENNANDDNPRAKEEKEAVRLMRMFNNLMLASN